MNRQHISTLQGKRLNSPAYRHWLQWNDGKKQNRRNDFVCTALGHFMSIKILCNLSGKWNPHQTDGLTKSGQLI